VFYETIDDITADAGIRVKASSLKQLVCRAVLATFNEITDISKVNQRETQEIQAEGKFPFLLADIINKALVIHETKGFVASGCKVLELSENSVKLCLFGETYNPSIHTSGILIKAATYHRLKVERKNGNYIAEIIFDI